MPKAPGEVQQTLKSGRKELKLGGVLTLLLESAFATFRANKFFFTKNKMLDNGSKKDFV